MHTRSSIEASVVMCAECFVRSSWPLISTLSSIAYVEEATAKPYRPNGSKAAHKSLSTRCTDSAKSATQMQASKASVPNSLSCAVTCTNAFLLSCVVFFYNMLLLLAKLVQVILYGLEHFHPTLLGIAAVVWICSVLYNLLAS